MQDHCDLRGVLADLAVHLSAAAVLVETARALSEPGGASRLVRNTGLAISTAMCCVEWRGRRCVLGPSLGFRMIHRLSQQPGRFFSYDVLMEEVWRRRCTDDAIRALVKRLRHALTDADMADLASAIQGRERSYGLFINGLAP